jgi:DNA-3-methyladenine glycosylase II
MWKKAEEFLLKDKYIGPLVKKYGPCKIRRRRKKDYFMILATSIVYQQLSIKAASAILGRLEAGLGGEITPEKILQAKPKKLKEWGLSKQKITYLKDLAKKVASDKLQVARLNELPDEEVTNELIAVKGIGPWTAEMFLMFSLARLDIFPVDDLGIRNGMKRLLKKKEMKPAEMIKFSERWKPYRSTASWYIWKELEVGS